MKKANKKQEENWELMTKLGIPWHHCNEITDASDREFLLEKVVEIEEQMKRQQAAQQLQGQGAGPMQYS
tara:strand:+ start:1764 stop:1970 length:207 start_codon:yes stop_codon:yes gene_type:complete